MSNQHGMRSVDRVEDPLEVGDVIIVEISGCRMAGAAVATEIDRHRVDEGLNQRNEIIPASSG